MRIVKNVLLTALALLLTALALGGLVSLFKNGGPLDLLMFAFLTWGAFLTWRARKR